MNSLLTGPWTCRWTLPADPDPQNTTRPVRGATHSWVRPTPVRIPKLRGWSESLAAVLHLSRREEDICRVLSGNFVPDGLTPFAACYGGHQFGNWAGQLGDGRAITLGELTDINGIRQEVQLKGAGPTPYSRRADGRAVLRSSLREFVMSEAMFHLGVPTTRALALLTTGEDVVRDMFYDGNAKPELGAIVTRVAPTFLRFGNFEIFASRGEHDLNRQLADWMISHFFSDHSATDHSGVFRSICGRTAQMIVHWLRVGFVHGVMNTDNMSVLGLTIDYGPFGTLDAFDPHWTPNTTDLPGRRYAYGAQPSVALWNLERLADAWLASGLATEAELIEGLEHYQNVLTQEYQRMMARRLGWDEIRPTDSDLIKSMEKWMFESRLDFILFWRELAERFATWMERESCPDFSVLQTLSSGTWDGEISQALLQRWWERSRSSLGSVTDRHGRMLQTNPRFVPKNWILSEVIEKAEKDDWSDFDKFMSRIRRPYEVDPDTDPRWYKPAPNWASSRPGCSTLSCSS